MTKTFVADPDNGKACRLVGVLNYVSGISFFVSCLAAVLASLATLGDVVTVRWLTEYGDPTFFDIVRVVMAGVGTFLFWQAIFRLLPELLFRKHLQGGTILKLDDSIVSLDLSTYEDPAVVRFNLQRDLNAYLLRYADRSCHQQ
jgi:hypothetical protein